MLKNISDLFLWDSYDVSHNNISNIYKQVYGDQNDIYSSVSIVNGLPLPYRRLISQILKLRQVTIIPS